MNLAVSEPSVRYVPVLNDREGDKSSLLEDAGCFPRPVRSGRSNQVRLQLVFEEV